MTDEATERNSIFVLTMFRCWPNKDALLALKTAMVFFCEEIKAKLHAPVLLIVHFSSLWFSIFSTSSSKEAADRGVSI